MPNPSSLLDHPGQVPPQTGRRFVVTGATGGLGIELTRALATAGADVVMAVRNTTAGEQAAERVRRTGAAGRVEVRRLDVADLSSIHDFAGDLDHVDVLINNAGIMGVPRGQTVDGFEMQIGTNHLGHFALTNLVLPKLTDRVVMLGSHAHWTGRLDVDDLDHATRRYGGYPAYAQSKLATLLFMGELQRRLTAAGSSVRAVGAHPGYTATGITMHTGNSLFTSISRLGNLVAGMKPWRGALPVLAAATLDIPGDTYLGPRAVGGFLGSPAPARRSRAASDESLAADLWQRSASLAGVNFPL
ncbi:MAG TPA: oxidoreductase [Nocardioides sp.]